MRTVIMPIKMYFDIVNFATNVRKRIYNERHRRKKPSDRNLNHQTFDEYFLVCESLIVATTCRCGFPVIVLHAG